MFIPAVKLKLKKNILKTILSIVLGFINNLVSFLIPNGVIDKII